MPDPSRVRFPGVYVQEYPNDARFMTPAETSTTAFVGRTLRGPVDNPLVICSFGDFKRIFGGLWTESAMSFAVEDFFLNGGTKAVVVRVNSSAGEATKATADDLKLSARSEGDWGNHLRVRVSYLNENDPIGRIAALIAKRYAVSPDDLFNLAIHDKQSGTTEHFENITVLPDGVRRLDRVLAAQSSLVSCQTTADGEPVLLGERPAEHPAPAIGKDVWDDDSGACSVFKNGADGGSIGDADVKGDPEAQTGLYALEHTDIFNLLCIPQYGAQAVPADVWQEAAEYCEKRRAMLIVDTPDRWRKDDVKKNLPMQGFASSANAAIFFPRIRKPNPARDRTVETFPACGAIAGVFARTDTTRGVWKAPAGVEATLRGVTELSVPLTDADNGELNPLGINCLRTLPVAGHVVWGARTMAGDDRMGSEWKYIPVRRLALFIEESIDRGTQWTVFEPNDESLWAQLRCNIGVFMNGLFRQGALQGSSSEEAYFVKCDSETTTDTDIDRGIVNMTIGFAPQKPAEFIVLSLSQDAGMV